MKMMLTVMIAAAFGLSVLAQPSEALAPLRTQITLLPAPSGSGLIVALEQKQYILPEQMSALDKAAEALGVSFGVSGTNAPLELRAGSRGRELVIEAAGFDGWGAKAEPGATCFIRTDFSRRIIDLTTAAANSTNAVVLRFHDGGKARMGAASSLRYDEFRDRSYYAAGAGNVDAENAEGQGLRLDAYAPPMTGGPFAEKSNGDRATPRLSPVLTASATGALLEKIRVAMGKTQVEFERQGETTVTLENGTTFLVSLDPDRHVLRWKVTKGYIRFDIGQIRCWGALLLSDQKADFQWDSTIGMVDAHNFTDSSVFPASREILCDLSSSNFASVGAGATFQYALLGDCDTFLASGYGGDVHMYNSGSGKGFELAEGAKQFRAGALVTTEAGGRRPKISVVWREGTPLMISSVAGTERGLPGERGAVTIEGRDLEWNYSENGVVSYRALEGDVTLVPERLGDWEFDLGKGDRIVFTLDEHKGTLTIQTVAQNRGDVNVRSPDGFNPVMHPDSSLTFFFGVSTTRLVAATPQMVFFESAGAGAGELGTLNLNNQPGSVGRTSERRVNYPTSEPGATTTFSDLAISAQRIPQAPVSNFN